MPVRNDPPRTAPCHPDRVYFAKDKCRKCYMNAYYAAGAKVAWNAAQRVRVRALKLEMIEAYGGKCSCCGEAEPDFLSLEHLNGGSSGKKGTAVGRLDYARTTSAQLRRELKRAGWPKDGYTCLCMNCNFAKGHRTDGRCPHEENR